MLDRPSEELREMMAAKGIFIRPMVGHHMAKGFIRITVGKPEQNELFVKTLKELIQELEGK